MVENKPAGPYWPPLVIDGAVIDLAHLDPLTLGCPIKEPPGELRINTRFSNHCFTEEFDPARHGPALLIMDHKRPRAFDRRRYKLSTNLPAMIAALPAATVHQTPERRNYLYCATLVEAGVAYQMFFTLRKAGSAAPQHLELFVESAYAAEAGTPARLKRPNAIRFAVLAWKTYKGEAVRFAPR
jgi:hypothetical protein